MVLLLLGVIIIIVFVVVLSILEGQKYISFAFLVLPFSIKSLSSLMNLFIFKSSFRPFSWGSVLKF